MLNKRIVFKSFSFAAIYTALSAIPELLMCGISFDGFCGFMFELLNAPILSIYSLFFDNSYGSIRNQFDGLSEYFILIALVFVGWFILVLAIGWIFKKIRKNKNVSNV